MPRRCRESASPSCGMRNSIINDSIAELAAREATLRIGVAGHNAAARPKVGDDAVICCLPGERVWASARLGQHEMLIALHAAAPMAIFGVIVAAKKVIKCAPGISPRYGARRAYLPTKASSPRNNMSCIAATAKHFASSGAHHRVKHLALPEMKAGVAWPEAVSSGVSWYWYGREKQSKSRGATKYSSGRNLSASAHPRSREMTSTPSGPSSPRGRARRCETTRRPNNAVAAAAKASSCWRIIACLSRAGSWHRRPISEQRAGASSREA